MLNERLIDRKVMPQIQAKNIQDCLNYLKKNGIQNKKETVSAGKIIPMQRLNQQKVEGLKASQANLDKPVLVTKDYELVDGHHRWAANRDLGNDVNIIKLSASFDDVYDALTNYSKVFYKDMNESVALVIRSYAGNSIIASVNGKKYEYIIDGDAEEIYRKAVAMSKHSKGKALNLIKKYAIETIKETIILRRFYDADINTLVEEIIGS
jgi:ParB-like nuclease domain